MPTTGCVASKKIKKPGSKSNQVRKVFVRNPIATVKSSETFQGKKRVQFADLENDDGSSSGEQTDFSLPEFCSILKLADEIRKVQLKPNSDLVRKEIEKMPKNFNLNFDPDERIYQDLISVQRPINEVHLKAKSSHSRLSTKKDQEPDYNELLKYSLQAGYKFTRFVVPEIKKPVPEFDGRSIYRLTRKLTVSNF